MEYYGINVGAWWIHGITLHTTDTMVYSETLWWSMVDCLNHGFHGMLLTHRWWHASAIVVGFALYAYAPPYGHYNTVLPPGRAGRPIDGP